MLHEGINVRSWSFWRTVVIFFCVFSLVGHWLEIPYCLWNDFWFGIVSDTSVVFVKPLQPFMVYGVGTVICTLILVPLRCLTLRESKNTGRAVFWFYVLTVAIALVMELTMGLLMNQPDPVTGVYPLWDNSNLPGNILGQAWIVNDVLLGALAMIYVWVVYPICKHLLDKLPEKTANIVFAIVVIVFAILCATQLP